MVLISVGILTGDVTINHSAPLLIMTTEIYRNMLLSNDPFVDDVAYVVFDEIHFLGDVERGTVWEESIIFSKEHVRFLCLSATIPNARQFANWIKSR
jgi:superfamily II RNA helicase